MKKFRKGFTLVELLVVIAILGTLSAAMTTSVSGSTAKAKAATIASNVETFKAIACMYVVDRAGEDLSSVTADNVMKAELPAWADLSGAVAADKVIIYTAEGTAGPSTWKIKVDFTNDPENAAIQTALMKIRGYGKYYKAGTDGAVTAESVFKDAVYAFTVELITGKIEPSS